MLSNTSEEVEALIFFAALKKDTVAGSETKHFLLFPNSLIFGRGVYNDESQNLSS
jgi:hypothetical protein